MLVNRNSELVRHKLKIKKMELYNCIFLLRLCTGTARWEDVRRLVVPMWSRERTLPLEFRPSRSHVCKELQYLLSNPAKPVRVEPVKTVGDLLEIPSPFGLRRL